MKTLLALTLTALLALPGGVGAATLLGDDSLTVSQPSSENAYLAGAHVSVTAPVGKDLMAAGGVIEVEAPVQGDVLAVAGTLAIEQAVAGDVRAAGSRITIRGPVGGDLALAGASIEIASAAHELIAAGGRIYAGGGATGSVRLYGADITLAGVYEGDVEVTASNSFTLVPGTYIKGTLVYDAPQHVELPEGVIVEGGASYDGSYAYVPTKEQADRYALMGSAVFIAVRALAGMITAGLIVGLFPRFVAAVIGWLGSDRGRRASLAGVLGLAVLLLTPLLLVLFFISFVGAGLGLILLALYVLLLLLAHAFADILVAALLRKHVFSRFHGRHELTWKDAIAGSLLLSLITLIPFFGLALTLILALISLGALSRALYRAAFHA